MISVARPSAAAGFDPDQHRMSVGEHLEELRKRLFLGLGGYVLVFLVCMIPQIGHALVYYVCRPLFIALARNKLPAQVHYTDPAEPFMTYIKAALITAAAVAGPWLLYQAWQFIAAGLYPHERKYVTKYLPLSVLLFVSGVTFLYFYVLPLMLEFFIGFQIGMPMSLGETMGFPRSNGATAPIVFPVLETDPANPQPGSVWINATTGMLKICISAGNFRVLPFGSESVTTPIITLGTYFHMVIGMLLSFGLAFQLPLVVLALVRVGIVEIDALRSARRIVYFVLTVVSAVIVPDVVTGMIALLVPLILLYEFGIFLASWGGTTRLNPAAE
jgi:Sec-independent protein secretion pathway component TatC